MTHQDQWTETREALRDLTSASAWVFNHIHTGRYTRGQVCDKLRGPIDRAQAALADREQPGTDGREATGSETQIAPSSQGGEGGE